MKVFDIRYRDVVLRVICDDNQYDVIKEVIDGHGTITDAAGDPTYTVVTSKMFTGKGMHETLSDKWFNNATMDCFIDNDRQACYIQNINADSEKNANSLLQTSVLNTFNRLLETKGYVSFHASSVEKDGKGVIFVAPRNSGKTCCMLNTIGHGFNLVCNDKVAVRFDPNGSDCYGVMDKDVNIRLSPEFLRVPENQKYADRARELGIPLGQENELEGDKLRMTPNELAEFNGVEKVYSTSMTGMVYPMYDPSVQHAQFTRLTPEQAYELLRSQQLPLVHPTKEYFKNIETGDVPEYPSEEALREICATYPFYMLAQNEMTNDEVASGVEAIINGEMETWLSQNPQCVGHQDVPTIDD